MTILDCKCGGVYRQYSREIKRSYITQFYKCNQCGNYKSLKAQVVDFVKIEKQLRALLSDVQTVIKELS